jgi:16S rRNA (cytosine1407-C5)-methyltransferase
MKEEFIERTSFVWNVSTAEAETMLRHPYKTIIRVNPLNVRKSTLASLKKQYISLKKLDWVDNAYSITNEKIRPSTLPEFADGEIIVQNAASFVPVLALNPQQNDRILDVCAAPGGKSSHIAALTGNKAELILNDTSRTRFFKMKKLMQTLNVEAEYSLRDGRYLSKEYEPNSFDKILLDAPCSGEATMNIDKLDDWSLATIKRLNTLQTKLLQDAFTLLKPGGTLVYSTCTIAPEENEYVIDALLRHSPTATVLQQQKLPVASKNGLTSWKGRNLDPQLALCIRLLPSDDCRPFFIAAITKTTTTLDDDDSFERLKKAYT